MATQVEQARLLKLSDTHLTVETPAEDIRGREVVDLNGDDIGTVEELWIDDTEKKVRFLEIGSGGFLGLGKTRFMIPVDAVSSINQDAVTINHSREHVAGAPQYDPEIAERPDWEQTYGYFGYNPYWSPGYTFPPYPYGSTR